MKLVEILAREMDEWPYGQLLAWQDPDKEVRFNPDPIHDFYASQLADDAGLTIGCGARVNRGMWEAERAKLNHAAEWDGDGLPPVGAVCECCWDSSASEYRRVKIIAHDNGMAVYRWMNGEKEGLLCEEEQYIISNGIPNFRPIRTTEQISAQEREQVLDDIYRIIRTVDRHGNKADMAEALYDAGYRKQEQDQ